MRGCSQLAKPWHEMTQADTNPEQWTLPTGVSLRQAYLRDVWLPLAKGNQIKNLKTGSVGK